MVSRSGQTRAGLFLGRLGKFVSKKEQEPMDLITRLHHTLTVSCQAEEGFPLNTPDRLTALAETAVIGGAKGIRASGPENIRAMKQTLDVPIIGIYKKDYPGFDVRITPTMKELVSLSKRRSPRISIYPPLSLMMDTPPPWLRRNTGQDAIKHLCSAWSSARDWAVGGHQRPPSARSEWPGWQRGPYESLSGWYNIYTAGGNGQWPCFGSSVQRRCQAASSDRAGGGGTSRRR
jgi:hypothetical protein